MVTFYQKFILLFSSFKLININKSINLYDSNKSKLYKYEFNNKFNFILVYLIIFMITFNVNKFDKSFFFSLLIFVLDNVAICFIHKIYVLS
jgi:hypothetical protein